MPNCISIPKNAGGKPAIANKQISAPFCCKNSCTTYKETIESQNIPSSSFNFSQDGRGYVVC
jgi:hypothetical protein